jgi:hypothetical protein
MGKQSQISAHCLNHRAWHVDGVWLENGESHRLFLYSPATEGIWRDEINFQKKEVIEKGDGDLKRLSMLWHVGGEVG